MPEPDARTQSARRQELTLIALFCLIPPLAVGGGLAIAPLAALCGLVAAPWSPPRRLTPAAWLILALAAWAALSLAWSPMPRPEQALKNAGAAVTGLLLAHAAAMLDEGARARVRAAILAGMVMLGALLGAEAAFDMAFNRAMQPEATTEVLLRNPGRGALVLGILGFAGLAAALALKRPMLRWTLALIVAGATVAPAFQFDMIANAWVVAIGAAAFAFGFAAPWLGPILIAGVLAAWTLLAPWLTLAARPLSEHWTPLLEPSWGMRLQIWSYAAERIAEKPLLGWGLDASRSFTEQRQLGEITHSAIPLHPHSFSLQVWLETGALGALITAAALVGAGLMAARASHGDRLAAATAAAGMATLGFAWNVSYGAWQEWLMAMPFIVAAAMLAMRRARA